MADSEVVECRPLLDEIECVIMMGAFLVSGPKFLQSEVVSDVVLDLSVVLGCIPVMGMQKGMVKMAVGCGQCQSKSIEKSRGVVNVFRS